MNSKIQQQEPGRTLNCSVEHLDGLLAVAKKLGYEVRYECLGGAEGGLCHVAGRKLLFLDLANTAADHLETVQAVLASDPSYRDEIGNDSSNTESVPAKKRPTKRAA